MTEFLEFATENIFMSQLIRIAQNYVSTMTELIMNTYDELKLAIPLQSAKFSLTNQDVTVLLTACCSLFGLIVAFFTVFSLVKCIYWICLGSNLSQRDVGDCSAQYSPGKLENSARWFKQAWCDLMAAKNDFEGDHPAPEWVCYKSQQAFEKGLKALLLASLNECTFVTHDICELAAMTGDCVLKDQACQVQGIIGLSPRMRYPDMLPSPKIPRDVYTLNDALTAHQVTQSSLHLIRHRLREITGINI